MIFLLYVREIITKLLFMQEPTNKKNIEVSIYLYYINIILLHKKLLHVLVYYYSRPTQCFR